MEKEENKNTALNNAQDASDEASTIKDEKIDAKTQTTQENQSEKKSPEDKILELEDKLARTFAEMENQRRRFEKEKEDAFDYGGFSFAKEALSLIDNLERSKQTLENDEALKNSDALKKILDHLDIVNKDLLSIFSKNGIKQIESLNKKLDPYYHQAMIEIEDDKKETGTIVQEIQKGFMIKDRLLRPSLVGVSKKIQNSDKKSEKNNDNSKENND